MQQKKILSTLALSATLLTTGLSSHSALAEFKCWTNDDGIKECGNTVPPKYAKKEIQTVDERGVVREVRPRQMTPEELAKAREEAEQQRLIEEEKRKQEMHDQVLMQTYLNIDDLLLSLDWKVSTLETRITVAQKQLESLNKKFDQQVARAAEFERKGKEVPARISGNLEDLRNQIRNTTEQIEAQQQEIDEIKETFARDVERFQVKSTRGKLYNMKQLDRARQLNSAVIDCDSATTCAQKFASAKQYAAKRSTTPVLFETEHAMVTKSPESEQDLAFSVTHIEQKTYPHQLVLSVRCQASLQGEELCASDKVSWILAEYKFVR